LQAEAEQLAASGVEIAILDAALLFEAGWDAYCDRVLFVEVPRELRLARARARGWSEEDFASRELRQWPVEEKRRRSDSVLDNSGSIDETQRQVRELWQTWLAAQAD
jgi:dephospho-CoA kinase